jgi:hypothetical protein
LPTAQKNLAPNRPNGQDFPKAARTSTASARTKSALPDRLFPITTIGRITTPKSDRSLNETVVLEISQEHKTNQTIKMNTQSTLEDRLDQLECRCRNLRRILGGFVVAGAAVCLIAAAPNPAKDSIQTKSLEVVDGNGKVRVRIGPADEGFGLVVYDKDGAFQATFTDAPLGAVMQLKKQGGGIKLMAMNGGSGITMSDENGAPRALILHQENESQIMLKDKEGKTVFSAPK